MRSEMRLGYVLGAVALVAGTVGIALAVSAGHRNDGGVRFGDAVALSAPTSVGAAPMFAASPAGTEAAAWVSASGGGKDGRLYVSVDGAAPAEVRDTLGPIEAHGESPPKIAFGKDGVLYAIYVVGKEVPNARFPLAALRFVRSPDRGRTWSMPVTVTSDGDFGSHNFHALHVAGDGTIYVSWLGSEGPGTRGSATWITRSRDGGATWAPRTRVDAGESCPCCRTALATGANGRLYVAWRTVLPGSIRDIVVARSDDGGGSWTTPVRVRADDWVFEGCPHAGPSLQVDSAGTVHVAWWTGKEGAAGAYYTRSVDGGVTFGVPEALGTAAFTRPEHVQLALDGPRTVLAAWDDGRDSLPKVLLRVSRDGGASFGPVELASEPAAAATFPVIALRNGQLTVAWSEQSREASEHEDHTRPNMKDPKAVMPLAVVGERKVVARKGVLRASW